MAVNKASFRLKARHKALKQTLQVQRFVIGFGAGHMWDRSCPTPLVTPQDTIVFDSGKAFSVYCALELSVADPPSRKEGFV